MAGAREFSLEPIRTDGWFERIGEGIGSFQALCDIIGAKFFAFAMITGARITALTVDRRVPENTLVDFVVGADDEEVTEDDTQRVTLGEFRRRLVAALVQEEPMSPPPERESDIEGLQQHVGVRYLLLASLFGYSLRRLLVDDDGSRLELLHDGVDESYQLAAFRARLRTHVREELDRAARGRSRGSIDLSRVAEAEQAVADSDPVRVVELLGAWPAPLSIFLRTPEGQLLGPEARATIARGLSLLGSACIELGDLPKGEEVLRLAVQYALEGQAAPDAYRRLGEALLEAQRPGEAIGPLRRAATLGGASGEIWPPLARAFLARGRRLAALAAVAKAREAGVDAEVLGPLDEQIRSELGGPLESWRSSVQLASGS
jgi:hypothetical protein